MVSQ
jgi:hypothetical protein